MDHLNLFLREMNAPYDLRLRTRNYLRNTRDLELKKSFGSLYGNFSRGLAGEMMSIMSISIVRVQRTASIAIDCRACASTPPPSPRPLHNSLALPSSLTARLLLRQLRSRLSPRPDHQDELRGLRSRRVCLLCPAYPRHRAARHPGRRRPPHLRRYAPNTTDCARVAASSNPIITLTSPNPSPRSQASVSSPTFSSTRIPSAIDGIPWRSRIAR